MIEPYRKYLLPKFVFCLGSGIGFWALAVMGQVSTALHHATTNIAIRAGPFTTAILHSSPRAGSVMVRLAFRQGFVWYLICWANLALLWSSAVWLVHKRLIKIRQ
ncbi:MAG TPA: hypothetical protein VLG16_01265 [Candidatus Saccharimonadales bacterium]|nr:hypothetical protein [Candidatus Saccharimonadales bacterium]